MYKIGSWQFDPQAGVLSHDGIIRSLEDRSARVLEVLCRRRGEIVSKDELLTEVWQSRAVSPNSVAIVIGDLRRALGDPASEPAHIMTLGKRGYRLTLEDSDAPARPPRTVTRYVLATVIILALAGAGAIVSRSQQAVLVDLVVTPVRNETGRGDYESLARSMTAVVTDRAIRFAGTRLLTSQASHRSDTPLVILDSRLIIWNGSPELAIRATDASTHAAFWSTFASGGPANLARNASTKMDALQGALFRARNKQ